MIWFILGGIVLVVIIVWRNKSKPKNFVIGVAKAQLKAYKTEKIRNPDASQEDLITNAICSRLNVNKYYSESAIRHDVGNGSGTYRQSIKILIIREYEYLMGVPPSIEILDLIEEQVDLIIPENL